MEEVKGSASAPLHAFRGQPAPAAVLEGWPILAEFPAELQPALLELAVGGLCAPGDPQIQRLTGRIEQESGRSPEQLTMALRAASLMLDRAVSLKLDSSAVAEDFATLSGGEIGGLQIWIDRFDQAAIQIAQSKVRRTLADHGKVLIGLDWRVDDVRHSNHGTELATSVIFLTMHYLEGDSVDRVSLQVTQETLGQLKQFIDRFSSSAQ